MECDAQVDMAVVCSICNDVEATDGQMGVPVAETYNITEVTVLVIATIHGASWISSILASILVQP